MHLGVREALIFHVVFFIAASVTLWWIPPATLGCALLWLTIAYHIGLLGWALLRAQTEWLTLWLFLLPLSVAQLLPDWALVAITKTLVFPDHGIARLGGAVPLYLAGMWTMLLFPIVLVAQSTRHPFLIAALLGFVLFAIAEWAARPLQLWYAQNVAMVGGVALYVLVAEVLLVLATLRAYRQHRRDGIAARFFAALGVSVFYAGALFLSLLLIDPVFSGG